MIKKFLGKPILLAICLLTIGADSSFAENPEQRVRRLIELFDRHGCNKENMRTRPDCKLILREILAEYERAYINK